MQFLRQAFLDLQNRDHDTPNHDLIRACGGRAALVPASSLELLELTTNKLHASCESDGSCSFTMNHWAKVNPCLCHTLVPSFLLKTQNRALWSWLGFRTPFGSISGSAYKWLMTVSWCFKPWCQHFPAQDVFCHLGVPLVLILPLLLKPTLALRSKKSLDDKSMHFVGCYPLLFCCVTETSSPFPQSPLWHPSTFQPCAHSPHNSAVLHDFTASLKSQRFCRSPDYGTGCICALPSSELVSFDLLKKTPVFWSHSSFALFWRDLITGIRKTVFYNFSYTLHQI